MQTTSTPLQPVTGHFAQDDSEQMLKLLELEILNRRAKRLAQGGDQKQAVRTLGIFIIFAMLMAVLGMAWYMQTSHLAQREGLSSRRAPVPAAAPIR